MNNNLNFTKKGLFLTEEVHWKSNASITCELLSQKEKISKIVMENLDSENNILLIKNHPFCTNHAGSLTFGIQLNLNSEVPSSSILELNELQNEKIRYSQYFNQYYHNSPDDLTYKLICFSHYETAEIKEIIENFSETAKYIPLVFLQIGKNTNVIMLAGNDLYDLKNASKLFRKDDDSYKEYFFQQNEDCPAFNKLLSLEEIESLNDDAHRVIFDK